jgi:hypothetical protein
MNHQVEAHIQGSSCTEGRIGMHMNARIDIRVPMSDSFAVPPPKKLVIDGSKVSVQRG